MLKMIESLRQLVYCFQKWAGMWNVLVEVKICPFWVKNDELLEKYNNIWDKASNSIKKLFHSESICSKKYLKSKIKIYER